MINGFKKVYETKDDNVADTSGDQNNTGATLSDQKKLGESNGVGNGNNNGLENGNALSGKILYDLLGARGVDDQRSAFHKDFKIKGFIVEVGQRDKLSYISLLKQIEEEIEKGCSNKEIVNAVLRAITPGLYLRNVLETTEDLTLGRLMKFLQSHFVERNTTDLCQHLSSITQGSQESSTQFVYCAMSLRQKLIVASYSPAAEIKYDKSLVQRLFLKALETGLTSEKIVTEIKPLLRNPKTTDEDLIFAVGQAASCDQQRNMKLTKSKIRQPGRVNALETGFESEDEIRHIDMYQSNKKVYSSSELVTLLKSVQCELSSLRTEMNTLKQKGGRDNEIEKKEPDPNTERGDKEKSYLCNRCLGNKETNCSHCFKCSGEGYIARRCPSGRCQENGGV